MLWPGKRVGFAVYRRPDTESFREALRQRTGPARFSGDSYDIFVVDGARSIDIAEPAETVE